MTGRPVADTDQIRPSRAGYWVGGVLLGVGTLVGALLFVVALSHSIGEFRDLDDDIDAMARFAVPGEDVVTLDEPGEYVVYAEGPVPPVGSVGAAAVTVESTEGDSTPLVLRSVGLDETYDIGDHAGTAALRFTVDEPGDYRVTVGQVPASVTGVAVGPPVDIFGPVGSVFVVIFVPAGVGGLFLVAGAAVLIVTGVRRSGAMRRARMSAASAVAWGAIPPGAPRPGPAGVGGVPPYGPGAGNGASGYGAPGAALPPGLPPSAYPPPGWPPTGWTWSAFVPRSGSPTPVDDGVGLVRSDGAVTSGAVVPGEPEAEGGTASAREPRPPAERSNGSLGPADPG